MEWYINHAIRYISPPQSSSDDDIFFICSTTLILVVWSTEFSTTSFSTIHGCITTNVFTYSIQVPYTYNMFPQQLDTFYGPTQNVFATSSSTAPSAYPTSSEKYYRPTMLPQMVKDINQRQQHEDNDDDDPVQSLQ
ncbi:hypothetical protein DEO72_LG7g2532 [Vigna unguiculata]|uniref:Uncharacterized protein n=1 Tax=Vigna unguiculata TaxID=3917 RepID=A0A4D6MMM6_VIGUN|nr:hypothetical protein DEO72_LG7g2532 [Vigna unguiculata]